MGYALRANDSGRTHKVNIAASMDLQQTDKFRNALGSEETKATTTTLSSQNMAGGQSAPGASML